MKKAVMIFLMTSILFAMSACKDQSVEEEKNHVVELNQVQDASLANDWSGNELWSKAYDHSQLHQALKGQIERWVTTDRAIPFYILNQLDQSQTDVVGLFRSVNDWELHGKTKENQEFTLKSNEDIAILEYDQYKEELSKVEFEFLLPLKHLRVLEELLTFKGYEFMKWREKAPGWSVQVHSSTEPINEAFIQFLLSHFTKKQNIGQDKLENYNLTYDLVLYPESEHLVIKSIQFSLEKEGDVLERILFHF
jgi:hypothetical protein